MNNPVATPYLFDHAALDCYSKNASMQGDHKELLMTWGADLIDRLSDIKRTFDHALCYHPPHSPFAEQLRACPKVKAVTTYQSFETPGAPLVGPREQCPFAPASFDLIVSFLTLDTVGDLPGLLLQWRYMLKPDGLLLALLPGGETLRELRDALIRSDDTLKGRVYPRVHPMVEPSQAPALLQRAGFQLGVVDIHRITLSYTSPLLLLKDLKAVGMQNALMDRLRGLTTRQTFALLDQYYPCDGDSFPATLNLLTLTGWAPSPCQQKPLQRGSATHQLADILKTKEISFTTPGEATNDRTRCP